MFRMILMAALLATPAAAQSGKDEPATPPKRIRNVLLFGQEACPKPESGDEIVVCSRAGESPYRIPEKFRERAYNPDMQPWTRRVEVVEEVNRKSLPGGCSAIGTAGQTGCTRAMIEQWRKERQAQAEAEAKLP